MERIIIAVEEWMYSNPLNFRCYLNIPHGVAVAFTNLSVKRTLNTKRRESVVMASFLDVLESLVGSDIHDYFGEL